LVSYGTLADFASLIGQVARRKKRGVRICDYSAESLHLRLGVARALTKVIADVDLAQIY